MATEKLPKYAPEKYSWLKRRIVLDLLAVDEELQEIGVLIQEAGEHAAFARETRDMAKAELQRTEAVVAHRLRGQSGPDGKPPSETKIITMLAAEAEVVEMNTVVVESKLDCDLWDNICDALRTKSQSMRAAADLVAAGFISQDYILSKRRAEIRQATPRAQVTT